MDKPALVLTISIETDHTPACPSLSNPRVIGDGLRNFESRSSDDDDSRAVTSFLKLPHHNNVRTLSRDRFNERPLPYMADLLWHQDSNSLLDVHEFVTMTICGKSACRDKDIPQCQSDRAIYSPPEDKLGTTPKLVLDAPACCLQASRELRLKRGGPCADLLRSPIRDD
ncbi:hypothetical protein TNCV_4496901 [Trichonephila clavipes]|nr:hypothetical protein TNCV_4496901 [Trichonephila clavipes]